MTADECLRKADQHWEMFSLALQDGDVKDADRHRKLAKEWEQKAKDAAA